MSGTTRSESGWVARKGKTWLWGFGIGCLTMALGIGLDVGKLGTVIERVKNGAEAIATEPTPTTPAPVAP